MEVNILNKKILLTLLILLAVILSAGVISASDVNVTDSYATDLVDDTSDVSVQMENAADSSEISVSSDSNVDNDPSKVSLSSEEVLESEDSNILSTNSNNNDNILSSDSSANYAAAGDVESGSGASSAIDASKSIVSGDITKYYKGTTKYTATFFDTNGNPLSNTYVTITVKGVAYNKKTDANGVASLAINLKPGTYKVVATNPATGYSQTTTFRILSTISAKDISKVYTDGRKFYAKFYKSNGKVLAKKTVKFKLKGKVYKVKTNSKGVASLSLKKLKKGTYKIISYNTDGLTKTNKIKVVKSCKTYMNTYAYTFLKSDTKKIKVQLLNAFGYAPGKGKIIKFKVNGKTYSKKTNSKGFAYLKLPSLKKGLYTVKYKFAGSGYYKASSASSKVAVITTKNPTFTVKSATTFTVGSTSTFKVAVTAGGVPLPKKTIKFNLEGKTYTKTTNNKGIASLSFKLPAGKHTITYSIAKTSKTNAKKGSSVITVKEKAQTVHSGYWLYSADMNSVNLQELSSKGVTDIFLNFKAYETYGKSGVETWIYKANSNGIKVHMWVQAFYTKATGWVNPLKDGKENTEYFNQKINEVKTYASIKGLSGIHFDYLRYSGSGDNAAYKNSGGTEAINSFVKQAVAAIKSVNSNLIVSCALMPETTSMERYYGQDYSTLSQYMDVVIPMVYKGNYGADASWITSTTKWYVDNSKGASVWTGLQTYKSDSDVTPLSLDTLNADITAAYNGGASGVVLFRYGVSNNVDFNVLASSASSGTISISDVVTGATNLKAFYNSNNRLPNTVTIGGRTFTLPEFLYVMSQAIYQIANSNYNSISVRTGVSNPSAASANTVTGDLYSSNYVTVAGNVANFIATNNRAPNYASSSLGNIAYSELVDSFSRILAFYGTNSRLPSYVTISYTSGSSSSSSSISITGTGLNEVAGTILASYYKSSTNCQVGNAAIKKVVNSLTSGLTSDYDKAKAIFNYVRDTLSYSFYYNTKYGAVGTLSAKTGNCVDHSHLLVAMFRTAGLAARYVHGTCKFTSGSTYGHVWTQVLIDGKWVVADATSSKNSLGKISNWNTNSFTLKGTYASLSF
jgi:transglutaminase-like putative cysteine protease